MKKDIKSIDNSKKKKENKTKDTIIFIILLILVIIMVIFTFSREAGNQKVILMQIYKLAGPNSSTATQKHYYIYENINTIEIRQSTLDNSTGKSVNSNVEKEISQNSITSLETLLNEYINTKPSLNTAFDINERYIIEYNGSTIVVPNPEVANNLGYSHTAFDFYNDVENFINNIEN